MSSLADASGQGCDAVCLEASIIWSIPKDVVLRFFEQRPYTSILFLQQIVAANEKLCIWMERLRNCDVRQRIMQALDELSQLGFTEGVRVSQSDFADLIGATRETTSTALNALQRQGIVKLGHRCIAITDMSSLQSTMQSVAVAAY
jgi:CRP/FNR family transcriptional regulator